MLKFRKREGDSVSSESFFETSKCPQGAYRALRHGAVKRRKWI